MTLQEFNPSVNRYGEKIIRKVHADCFRNEIHGWDAARFRVEIVAKHPSSVFFEMPLYCIWTCMERSL